MLDQSPDASDKCCWPDSANRPTGARRFWAFSLSEISGMVSPAAFSFSGSSTTSISRESLACTSMTPAPGTRASPGRITYNA